MEEVGSLVKWSPTAQPAGSDIRAISQNLQVKYNVTYIVAAVVIDGDKVLMVQEAKISCRGSWYLPAGRMERDETIVEAVKREVLEEAGVNFEPEALVAVEFNSHMWVRFTLTGHITGGKLKTTAEADRESLQAGWFSADVKKLSNEVTLRAHDIIPLIKHAGEWYKSRLYVGLPSLVGHVSQSLRLLVVHAAGESLRVLTKHTKVEGTSSVLPVVRCSKEWIDATLKSCGCSGVYTTHGVLSMEHLGKPSGVHDGFCICVLISAESSSLEKKSEYHWTTVEDTPTVERLRIAMTSEMGTAKLIDY